MSDDVKEALEIFCDALQAATEQLKQNLKPPKPKPQPDFKPDCLKWLPKQGDRGPYERAPTNENGDHRAEFDATATTVRTEKKDKKGISRGGLWYWLFDNGDIGRKKTGGNA